MYCRPSYINNAPAVEKRRQKLGILYHILDGNCLLSLILSRILFTGTSGRKRAVWDKLSGVFVKLKEASAVYEGLRFAKVYKTILMISAIV